MAQGDAAGRSHIYNCDPIEIGIEIEKVGNLDFDADFDFDSAAAPVWIGGAIGIGSL
jgi:hypothetical protein